MKFSKKQFAIAAAMLLGAVSLQAQADVMLTLTKNSTIGGTDFAFSKGTGTVADYATSNFLVGDRTDAPLGFATGSYYGGTLTLLAGTNSFDIQRIFSYEYGGLWGTNGEVGRGFDFQGGVSMAGAQISDLNGLVLNASGIDYASFTPGTYVLPTYYAGYQTDLGKFTLQIGAAALASDVPEPGSLALLGLGLAGAIAARRRK